MIVLISKKYYQTYRRRRKHPKTPYTIIAVDTDDHQAPTEAKSKTVQFQQ